MFITPQQQPVATLAHPHLISPSIACTDPNEVLRSPIQFQGWLKILDGNIVNDVYEGSWQLAYFSLRTPWLIMSERPNSEPCGVLDLRKCHSVRACFAKGGFLHDPFMFVDCFQIGYRGTDNRIIFAVADLDHFSKDWIGALGTAIVKLSSTFVDDDSDGNEDDDEDVNVSMSMIPPFFQSPRQNVSMRAAKSLAIKSEWLMIFNPSMGGWWQRLFCVLDSSKFLVAKSESSNVEGEFPLSSIQRFSTFKTENKNTFEIVNNQKEVLLVDAGSVAALNGWMGTLALALLTVNSASRQGNNVTLNDDPPHNVPANSKASNTNQTATNEISGAEDANRPKILSVSFNQDAECFTCGASNGFIVYNIDPFCEVLHCSPVNNDGGIRIVEMLHRTNLFALVGDDHNALHPNNMLKIWDHQQQKSFVELQFRSEVKAVKLRRDRVIVALDNEVYVYRLHDFHLLNRISTAFNPEGLFSVCSEAHGNMLAIPGEIKGSISIINLDDAAIQQTTPIHAYAENEDLAQFTLSSDGSLIASTSTEGSSIHIWNCRTGELIREFCTGCDGAVIYSLVFNAISTLIACCSDAGPIRIFSLIIGDSNETLFSQCDVNASSRPICAFSKDSSKLIVISQNGSMMVTRVGEDECVQISTTTYWK